jgi:hypothetical protein
VVVALLVVAVEHVEVGEAPQTGASIGWRSMGRGKGCGGKWRGISGINIKAGKGICKGLGGRGQLRAEVTVLLVALKGGGVRVCVSFALLWAQGTGCGCLGNSERCEDGVGVRVGVGVGGGGRGALHCDVGVVPSVSTGTYFLELEKKMIFASRCITQVGSCVHNQRSGPVMSECTQNTSEINRGLFVWSSSTESHKNTCQ